MSSNLAVRDVDKEKLGNMEFVQANKLITDSICLSRVGSAPVDLHGECVKSATLAQKRVSWTLYDQRLLFFLATQISNANPVEFGEGSSEGFRWWFTTRSIAENCGLPLSCKAAEIRKIVGKLRNTEVLITNQQGRVETQTSFILEAEYKSNGEVGFLISKKILPFYRELEKNFTPISYRYVTSIKSINAVNLYLFLKSRHNYMINKGGLVDGVATIEVEIEQLRKVLRLEHKKAYQSFSALRQRVLERAKEELDTHTDLSFVYDKEGGRSVEKVVFKVSFNNNKKLEGASGVSNDSMEISDEEVKSLLLELLDNSFKAEIILRKHSDKLVVWACAKVVKQNLAKVDNPFKYIMSLIVKYVASPENVPEAHEMLLQKKRELSVTIIEPEVAIDYQAIAREMLGSKKSGLAQSLTKEEVEVQFSQWEEELLEQESDEAFTMLENFAEYRNTGRRGELLIKAKVVARMMANASELSEHDVIDFIETNKKYAASADQIVCNHAEIQKYYATMVRDLA